MDELLITIDPGVHHLGMAVFSVEYKTLIHACLVSGLGGAAHPLLETHAPLLLELETQGIKEAVSLVERPKIYDTASQKGDQRDITNLTIVTGIVVCVLGKLGPVALVEPSAWKGQVPKDIHNERVMDSLTEDEKNAITWAKQKALCHNIIDAIGLGKWRLGKGQLHIG